MKSRRRGTDSTTKRRGKPFLIAGSGTAVVVAAAILVYLFASTPADTSHESAAVGNVAAGNIAIAKPDFVGSSTCASCHGEAYRAWLGSHHQLAMQPITGKSVLGDFDNVQFADDEAVTTFFREAGKFMVRTTGPDGKPHTYPIRYTFGVYPLQQYLIALPGGRLQAFDIAWDSRPEDAGGQRWFALYPGHNGDPASPLHWTARDQTWNYMCADCHSTDVRKNYDAKTRSYHTTYAEVSVGCEACHGPGSNHVAWAKNPKTHPEFASNKGLTVVFKGNEGVTWRFDAKNGVVRRSRSRTHGQELQTCARCHSLRQPIDEDFVHGQPVGDDYRVALLTPEYYFSDGQIKGEVFEYGSFIQSRMHHAGVTCTSCHNPHTAELRATGNKLCTSCHLAKHYDTPRHTHHPVASKGAQCVACHMPTRTYMRVDIRHDHSLRIPRPDLTVKLGTPNACNQCHRDQSPQWAARHVEEWFGTDDIGFQQFAAALEAGREGAPDAGARLAGLVKDGSQPAIARATALHLLALHGYPHPGNLIEKAANNDSALVRRAGAGLLRGANLSLHLRAIAKLLDDPVRSVRIRTANALAGVQPTALPASAAVALKKAANEYLAARRLNADRPEAHLNLAAYLMRKHEFNRAQQELVTALELDPAFAPAAINLVDLYRLSGQTKKAETTLKNALKHSPDDPALLFSLALLKVRQDSRGEALDLLARTVDLAPSNPRYSYVYAIALHDGGKIKKAITVLEKALQDNPRNRRILAALVAYYTEIGDPAAARKYRKRLNHSAALN